MRLNDAERIATSSLPDSSNSGVSNFPTLI